MARHNRVCVCVRVCVRIRQRPVTRFNQFCYTPPQSACRLICLPWSPNGSSCVCFLWKPYGGTLNQQRYIYIYIQVLKRRPQALLGMHTEATLVHKTYTNPMYVHTYMYICMFYKIFKWLSLGVWSLL